MDLIDIRRHDLATPSKGEIRTDGTVSQLLATGYVEGEAIAAAELQDGVLMPAGLVKFGLGGKELRHRLHGLHAGLADLSGIIPARRSCSFFARKLSANPPAATASAPCLAR
jgi:hypothetical protein